MSFFHEGAPIPVPALPDRQRGDKSPHIWAEYTRMAGEEAERADKYKPADETAPHGYFDGRPIIGRHSPRINGSVDYLGRHQLAIIIDDSIDPIIPQAYARLQRTLKNNFLKPKNGTMDRVYAVTKNILPYRNAQEEKFDISRREDGYHSVYLGAYINNEAGVCRQQALLAGYLLEKLKDDSVISGNVHINRSIVGKNGHEWVRWTDANGEIIILDPAQHFVGTLEQAKKRIIGWRGYDIDMDEKPLVIQKNTSWFDLSSASEHQTGIDRATSFGELYAELIKKGGIEGSLEHFKPEELIKIIEDVRAGKRSINAVTRVDGLRFKVLEFLDE